MAEIEAAPLEEALRVAHDVHSPARMTILTVTPSKTKIAATKANELFAVVSIKTPAPPATAQRAPVELVVALDNSGSMNGITGILMSKLDPSISEGATSTRRVWQDRYDSGVRANQLDVAKHALLRLVDNLNDTDMLGLVTFETTVRAIFAPMRMTADNKDRARRAIRDIQHMGGTNLAAGLYDALRQLRSVREKRTNAVRRVMVFTDGGANEGDTNPIRINEEARRIHEGQIGVTTLGFGSAPPVDFMRSLTSGGGTYYFIDEAEKLPTAFGAELGSLTSLYARDTEVTLLPGAKVKLVEVLNDLPKSKADEDGACKVTIGDLYTEQTFNLVVKLETEVRKGALKTATELLEAQLTLKDVATGGELKVMASAKVEFVSVRSAQKKEDPEVMSIVAVQENAQGLKAASESAKRGDMKGARKLLDMTEKGMMARGRADLASMSSHIVKTGYSSEAQYRSYGQGASASLGASFNRQTANASGNVGGVDVDKMFENKSQERMKSAFSITVEDDDMPPLDRIVTSK